MKGNLFLHAAVMACLASVMGNAAAAADLKFANMVSDNMVLQQKTDARIWGNAQANQKVTVKASWSDTEYTAKANGNGKWEVMIPTPEASFEACTIQATTGKESIEVNNVLIGEVWLCSGQSNMEMQLQGFSDCPIDESLHEIAVSTQYKGVRMFNVSRIAATEVKEDVQGKWETCNPATSGNFSAVGYFFGTTLSTALDVPVGIINASWGGSVIEAWIDREYLEGCEDIDLADASSDNVRDMYRPMVMYNGMFKPASRYAINGIVWFQGESNISIASKEYADRLTHMAQKWREDIGRGDILFQIIQLAPYEYHDGQYGLQDEQGPRLREQQQIAQTRIPNSVLIGTVDLVKDYEAPNVHFAQKRKVGERCCYAALAKSYGYSNLQAISPTFKSMTVNNGKVLVSFNDAPFGFIDYGEITGFELAGEGGHFHPATATVSRRGVTVESRFVPDPVYVRYCFHDFATGNLTSVSGLPAIPFRTDSFDY